MASVNFNNAANSALRNLQTTNTSLDATQSRISTGLKIGEAKDNAAYWSFSTTLKSDNEALSTVSDALGLGAATVDTAYQGLNATKDVLNEIKNKISLATQDGTDKVAIQGEIKELQQQLKAIAESSTFSGQNYLAIDSSATDYNATKYVVSGFNRTVSGGVTLETIAVDTSSFALTNAKSGASGILDGGKTGNSTNKGGLTNMTTVSQGANADAGVKKGTVDFAFSGAAATDRLIIKYRVDADASDQTFNLVLATGSGLATDGAVTLDELIGKLNTDATFMGKATASREGNRLVLTSKTTGTSSVMNVVSAAIRNTGDTGAGTNAANLSAGEIATGTDSGANASVAASSGFGAFGAAIKLDSDDEITFNIAVDGADAKTVTINAATLTAVGITDGEISDADEYATVVAKALQNSGLGSSSVTVTNDGGTVKIVSANAVAGNGSLQVSSTGVSKGFSVLGLDVTTANKATLTKYLDAVNSALNKVTTAASTLGAVSKRIDLQKEFATKLMDTIDKGVSGLIDADMNEESTKLQALQVKQSLGVQALSIANQSAQSVLRLFQ